ncbi:MAG: CBS domain-containing protein [Nitrospina sp.]|jgi:CBS domain-containing protein|nr:CBS domain-containing protein [Nitrospina sp.]MBT6855854.1 CBS domain-containing protein [Nitrospina sp.]MBT7936484.1 CBS domain-containing protein [Nitrospina sp.]
MQQDIKTMKAEDVMASPVLCCLTNTSLKTIADKLATTKYHGIPIINENQELVGIITEKNVLQALTQGKNLASTLAEEVMSFPVVTAERQSMLSAIINVMMEKDITRVVIIENNKAVGIVSQHDIVKKLKKDDFVEL